MNAKGKAKELVDKFLNAEFNCKECNMPFCDIPCTKLSLFEAKQCAIISVDEIIKAFYLNTGSDIVGNQIINFSIRESDYWQEVKQEIQNL